MRDLLYLGEYSDRSDKTLAVCYRAGLINTLKLLYTRLASRACQSTFSVLRASSLELDREYATNYSPARSLETGEHSSYTHWKIISQRSGSAIELFDDDHCQIISIAWMYP
jgi:hypothetical protein